MAIPIEQNIPLPPRRLGSANAKYPFKQMKIGDSFFVSAEVKQNTLYSAARFHKVRISTRREQQNGTAGFRVWRIA